MINRDYKWSWRDSHQIWEGKMLTEEEKLLVTAAKRAYLFYLGDTDDYKSFDAYCMHILGIKGFLDDDPHGQKDAEFMERVSSKVCDHPKFLVAIEEEVRRVLRRYGFRVIIDEP
tara:strand:+ start:333 stop:677 length:345 start_codon:yes stop_codon:yes gene_type:complete